MEPALFCEELVLGPELLLVFVVEGLERIYLLLAVEVHPEFLLNINLHL